MPSPANASAVAIRIISPRRKPASRARADDPGNCSTPARPSPGRRSATSSSYSVAGVNAHYGTPTNVRAPGHIPGGSSSGSAAATAAGVCDFALGSDTGGSIRVPASFCGLYGLRPTHGRVDHVNVVDMAPSFDTPGWFANGPGVFRRVGSVLLDNARVDVPIKQMIVADDAFAQADPEVAAVLNETLKRAAADLPKPEHRTIAPNGFDAVARGVPHRAGLRDLAELRFLCDECEADVRSRRQRAHGKSRRPSRRNKRTPPAAFSRTPAHIFAV